MSNFSIEYIQSSSKDQGPSFNAAAGVFAISSLAFLSAFVSSPASMSSGAALDPVVAFESFLIGQ